MVALRHRLEQEQQTLDCITQNSDFYRVVLEREVLCTAIVANMDRLREPLEEPLPNSYDEFYEQGCTFTDCIWVFAGYCAWLLTASLCWVHDRLGRAVRKVISACVVSLI